MLMYPALIMSSSSVSNRHRASARSNGWLAFVAGMANHPGGEQICSDAKEDGDEEERIMEWARI